MKHFHRNLLVVLALALCGLCVYQWRDQVAQRQAINRLNQFVFDRDAAIQKYTNSLATLNRQVADFDTELAGYKATVASNSVVLASQQRELQRLTLLQHGLTNEVAQYQAAIVSFSGRVAEDADDLKKQDAALKELIKQRDDLVEKFNREVTDRNAVVAKYNALVQQINQARQAAKDSN
jgi:chromosome segregation ATPase